MKKLLILEPFYTGSHKKWIEGLKKYLTDFDIDLLWLEGRHWKWRMHGAAVTFTEILAESATQYDLILASDMLDIALFKSLNKKLNNIPIVMYFHENQFSYPLKEGKNHEEIDLHYGYMNYSSALAADKIFFNSEYHCENFFKEIKTLLERMPDNKNLGTLKRIKEKSDVLHIGIDYPSKKNVNKNNDTPVILWNHRWEHDKNPEGFYRLLIYLNNENIDFNLILLGENFKEKPESLKKIENFFKKKIIHSGYCENYTEYCRLLQMSDILPVTNIQDFFGISIAEALYFGAIPLLPMRLSYKELYLDDDTEKYFYTEENELFILCRDMIDNFQNYKTEIFENKAACFGWKAVINKYKKELNNIIA